MAKILGVVSWKDGTPIDPIPIDLTPYTCPEQLERLGPKRLTGALKWFGFDEKILPRNGVQLSRRLFSTKGVPVEEVTEDFFNNWDESYDPVIPPQFLDLRSYTRQTQLEELGILRLKAALKALGLKSGGHLTELAARLFATRGVPREKLPINFFPDKHGLRSTAKRKAKRKEENMERTQNRQVSEFLDTIKPGRGGRQAANNKSNAGNNRGNAQRRGTGWQQRSREMSTQPPPPPPPKPPSDPPPPPPPPPPGQPSSAASRRSQAYGTSQQPSSYYVTTVATTPGTAATPTTGQAASNDWKGQNYAPPSAYEMQSYNMYQPGTLSGYAFGTTPTGAAGTAAGYLSTGTYVQPARSSSATATATSYVVNTAAVQQTTQSWSQSAAGTSSSNYAGYPSSATTSASYPSSATTSASSTDFGAGYFSRSESNNTSNYSASGSLSQSGVYSSETSSSRNNDYNNYQTNQSATSSYNTTSQSASTYGNQSASTYDNQSVGSSNNRDTMSTNWPDTTAPRNAEGRTPQTTRPSVPYTTTNWKKSATSDVDDTGSANAWVASYGVWPDKEREIEKNFRSRWDNDGDSSNSVKGVTVGKALSASKFKMMQCKDCNVFLSSEDQYKEHMVSEKHILKIGGDMAQVRAAQKAQEEMDRPRFHPYWRKERQQTQQGEESGRHFERPIVSRITSDFLAVKETVSQKTIDEVEAEKARMFSMRYERNVSSIRDPGGFAPGKFGRVRTGRHKAGGRRVRERREQHKQRRQKERSGKVTRSDDEDDIYRRLPSQMEHRGLGFVERGGYPEIKDDLKLDLFVKKGQLHMDTGMRLDKYFKRKQQEEMGAPVLPESGVPQFGRAPPPKDYDMPRQSLIPKGFGAKRSYRDEQFKISFDTPLDIMRAAIIIPLLVPYLHIPGMDKIKEAMMRGFMPPQSETEIEGLDLIEASKKVATDLEKAQDEEEGKERGNNRRKKKDEDNEEATPTLSSFLKEAGHRPSTSAMDQENYNEDSNPGQSNKLLTNLSSLVDKPDVLHNPAVLNFLAQTQPAVVAKVKPAKPIMKKLPPAVIEEVIYKAQQIANEMEMQMEIMMQRQQVAQLEMQYQQEIIYKDLMDMLHPRTPGLLGRNPNVRKPKPLLGDNFNPLRRSRSLDNLDDDGYYGDYEDGMNNDQYARRFGFDEEDYDWDDRPEMYDTRGPFRGIEPGPWGGPRPHGGDFGARDMHNPVEFYGRILNEGDDEYSNFKRVKRGREPLDDAGDNRSAPRSLYERAKLGIFDEGAMRSEVPQISHENEYSNFKKRGTKRQSKGTPEEELEKKRELRRQRRRAKKEHQKQAAAADDEDDDGSDDETSHPIRSALPPQLLGAVSNIPGGDDYSVFRAKQIKRHKPESSHVGSKGKTNNQRQPADDEDDNRIDDGTSHPIRSALPPQLLGPVSKIPEGDDYSVFRAKQTKRHKPQSSHVESKGKANQQRQAADDNGTSHPIRSALPPQLLGSVSNIPEGDDYSVFRAKQMKRHKPASSHVESGPKPGVEKAGGTHDGSNRSGLPAQVKSSDGKQGPITKKKPKNDVEEADDNDDEPVRHHRSSLPPQLLAMMGGQGPSPQNKEKKAKPIPKQTPPRDTAKKAKESDRLDSVENVEVDNMPIREETNMQKSPREKQAALKSFKIPKKQKEPPPKKQKVVQQPPKEKPAPNKEKPAPNKEKQVPNKVKQAPNKEKQPSPESKPGKAKQEAKEPQTEDAPTRPIRSAIPAQLLMMMGDAANTSSASKKDAKAKEMGLPTEEWQQGEGGGSMTRRSTRKLRRSNMKFLF